MCKDCESKDTRIAFLTEMVKDLQSPTLYCTECGEDVGESGRCKRHPFSTVALQTGGE